LRGRYTQCPASGSWHACLVQSATADAMPNLTELLETLSDWLGLDRFPTLARIVASMDLVAWTLVGLLVAAVVLGVLLSLSTRRTLLSPEDVESTPKVVLARLKQDPTRLSPVSIISRLGADATLELLEYGDQVQSNEWRYKWSTVREELLHLLGRQNAFGPTYALARYYGSADPMEPDTLRIRRTVLVHKLGRRLFLDPNADGEAAQLRVRCHAAEVEGDLGFDGEELWLMPNEPAPQAKGPLIEMEPIEFRTLNEAVVHMHIRRSPMVGGGFRLELEKRGKLWVVVNEQVEWVS
jgi:hypothetical protein